jgi:HNH endonuclease
MTFTQRRRLGIRRALSPKRKPIGARLKVKSTWGGVYWKIKTGTYYKDWEWEHRVVAAKMLGRKLKSDEHVHHIDGNGLNNDPQNLQVLSAGAHSRLHHKGKKNPRKASR